VFVALHIVRVPSVFVALHIVTVPSVFVALLRGRVGEGNDRGKAF
jgi:hypothetical protein